MKNLSRLAPDDISREARREPSADADFPRNYCPLYGCCPSTRHRPSANSTVAQYRQHGTSRHLPTCTRSVSSTHANQLPLPITYKALLHGVTRLIRVELSSDISINRTLPLASKPSVANQQVARKNLIFTWQKRSGYIRFRCCCCYKFGWVDALSLNSALNKNQ